jgi:hypothetical protein
MWPVTGRIADLERFGSFEPVEVLYDFDGPRTFTHRDRDGELCLAHWCDGDAEGTRFVVAAVTEEQVQKLKKGELTLREALDQPRVWVVDLAPSGEPRHAWVLRRLLDLPPDVLPRPGTMLLPSLEKRASRES